MLNVLNYGVYAGQFRFSNHVTGLGSFHYYDSEVSNMEQFSHENS